jgi:hypothetical protein
MREYLTGECIEEDCRALDDGEVPRRITPVARASSALSASSTSGSQVVNCRVMSRAESDFMDQCHHVQRMTYNICRTTPGHGAWQRRDSPVNASTAYGWLGRILPTSTPKSRLRFLGTHLAPASHVSPEPSVTSSMSRDYIRRD